MIFLPARCTIDPRRVSGAVVLSMFLALSQAAMAQSRWVATTVDGTTYEAIYRLNGMTDTLVSAPSSVGRGAWRQIPLSDVRELRKVYSDAWWYMPAATAALGTAAAVIDGRAFDDGLVAIAWVVVVGGATTVAGGSAAMLATDEVHDLGEMSPAEKERVVGMRIPIAFGSREEGITRLDPASPPGRRVSSRSVWAGGSFGYHSWSDGYSANTLGVVGSYWLDEHLFILRYRGAEQIGVRRGTLALSYGRGISFERSHATLSAGLAYEYSIFDPISAIDTAYHPLFHTAGVVLDGEIIWPVGRWLGFGFGANAGLTLEGAYAGMTFSLLFGDLD